jgi:hypothetical protein
VAKPKSGSLIATIKGITVDGQQRYAVDYETAGFKEQLTGPHVHFFFDTVPPAEAGVPGKGPWIMYGGPRPFTGYKVSDRPADAFSLCALVADPDHSVRPESGNCSVLPDVVAVAAGADAACRQGPGDDYASSAELAAGQVTLVKGISPDELWWNVADPQNRGQTCWLAMAGTTVSGNIGTLPLVEAPPPAVDARKVTVKDIAVDEQQRFRVEYEAEGFTESLPGTHLHFFFDTVSVDQVGLAGGGNRRMYGGPSPFTGYAVADRPAEAKQLCVVIANPDHSVVTNSANCLDLP